MSATPSNCSAPAQPVPPKLEPHVVGRIRRALGVSAPNCLLRSPIQAGGPRASVRPSTPASTRPSTLTRSRPLTIPRARQPSGSVQRVAHASSMQKRCPQGHRHSREKDNGDHRRLRFRWPRVPDESPGEREGSRRTIAVDGATRDTSAFSNARMCSSVPLASRSSLPRTPRQGRCAASRAPNDAMR
jgi:hypothetical protein